MFLYKQTTDWDRVKELGKEGWELITMTTIQPDYMKYPLHTFVLKRESGIKCPVCGTKNIVLEGDTCCWKCQTEYKQRHFTFPGSVKGTATYYTKPEPEED